MINKRGQDCILILDNCDTLQFIHSQHLKQAVFLYYVDVMKHGIVLAY